MVQKNVLFWQNSPPADLNKTSTNSDNLEHETNLNNIPNNTEKERSQN